MQLTIPDHYKSALQSLVKLDENSLRKLTDEFTNAPPAPFLRDFARRISEKLKLPLDQALSLVRMLASLNRLRVEEDVPVNDFATDVVTAARRKLASKVEPPQGWDKFR